MRHRLIEIMGNQSREEMKVELFNSVIGDTVPLPLISEGISAGFPSPALDFIDVAIDLNKYVIKRPSSTFYGRAKGQSMKDRGIDDGDLMVIDKSIQPKNGHIAICYIEGSYTVKTIEIKENCCWLIPANKAYQPIKVEDDNQFLIWGIVTYVIKKI